MRKVICCALLVIATTFAQAADKRPKITGIDHVDFYTTSPEANEHLYTNVLGLQSVPPIEPGQTQRFMVGSQWVGYSTAPDNHAINRMDLAAFRTEDCEAMRRYLAAKGIKVPASIPSRASFYLKDEADKYPTAWVDLDGNERASIGLRNSDLNKIHILLLQIAKRDLNRDVRAAAISDLQQTIARHRAEWTQTADQLEEELKALPPLIAAAKAERSKYPKRPNAETRKNGIVNVVRRLDEHVAAWQDETKEYTDYIHHLRALLALDIDPTKPFQGNIEDLVPEMSLGDHNSLYELQNYVAGPAAGGLVLDANGNLDEELSFVHVNYFEVFAAQRALNNPQGLAPNPVDFAAVRIPSHAASQVFWLSDGDDKQLLILKRADGEVSLRPVSKLCQDIGGKIQWQDRTWRAGLPLRLFEDPALRIPAGADRSAWLSSWHTEKEWFNAIAQCRYSNGVIGITEQFSPVADNVPGTPGMSATILRYERRRRELVQPDLQLFASDHWNFNVRNVNPGGNHGSFLRISTHSVWMMSGAGIPAMKIEEPHDSLDFAPCLMNLAGVPGAPPSFCSHLEKAAAFNRPYRDSSLRTR